MSEHASEKRHEPSKKRMEDLRKKGQILRSKDLNGGLVVIAFIILLLFFSDKFSGVFKENITQSFSGFGSALYSDGYFYEIIASIFKRTFGMLSSMLIIGVVIVLLAPFLFGGWNFSLSSVSFKTEKLSVSKNLKRIFSAYNIMEVIKSLIKVFLIISAVIGFVIANHERILSLFLIDPSLAMSDAHKIIKEFLGWTAVTIILVVPMDLLISYWQFQQQAKMTTQELKDEQKETDGNPESKKRMRLRQMSVALQSLNTVIPKATVLITNPTHYAVALQYRDGMDNAPKILAKGTDLIAQRMRYIAGCNGITIYQAPVLARAIYYTSKIGGEIHPELYMAVAIVLSYIHQLRNYQMGQGQFPNMVDDLKIPEAFVFPERN